MSVDDYKKFQRVGDIPFYGVGTCRGCQGPVPKGRRRYWCSESCVIEAQVRKGDPRIVRSQVFARDKGVCAKCGIDCGLIQRVMNYLIRWSTDQERMLSGREAARLIARHVTNEPRARADAHLWEADHIVPVVEGGGGCGLDGYRTLCKPCHKVASAELARRRALDRREGRMPLLGGSN